MADLGWGSLGLHVCVCVCACEHLCTHAELGDAAIGLHVKAAMEGESSVSGGCMTLHMVTGWLVLLLRGYPGPN